MSWVGVSSSFCSIPVDGAESLYSYQSLTTRISLGLREKRGRKSNRGKGTTSEGSKRNSSSIGLKAEQNWALNYTVTPHVGDGLFRGKNNEFQKNVIL